MHARVCQDVLDHTFGGGTGGLVLLEDNKHFQSSVYISSYLTIHIGLPHTSHSIVERNKVEVQPASTGDTKKIGIYYAWVSSDVVSLTRSFQT